MARTWLFWGLAVAALPAVVLATQESGSVRAADQFIPGATVTARQGDAKVVGYTDENGRYSLNLAPGVWDISVQMLGFTTVQSQVTVGAEPGFKEWALEMPRLGGTSTAPAPAAAATPGAAARRRGPQGAGGRGFGGQGRGGFGRGGQPATPVTTGSPAPPTLQQRPGFQNATPTVEDDQALADAAAGFASLNVVPEDADSALLVNGSTSGGLAAAGDQEAQRQRAQAGRGPGGPGGGFADASGLGLPPGMSVAGGDSLGIGGFGAAAIDAGFAGGAGGGPGIGAGPGGGFGGGPGGAGGGGRGGGRGGGGGGGGGGGRGGRGNGGQFANFGNRRRSQPSYTGSVSLSLSNSFLNASPFSLNGQPSVKAPSDSARYTATIGGPMVIPKLLNWQRASFNITYQGSAARTGSNAVGTVPTPAERAGDFSPATTNAGQPVKIYDPLSNGQQFPNNVIPASRLDPAALGLLNFFPQQTYPGLIQNYRLVTSNPAHSQNIGVRLNAPLNNKNRLSFNVQYQDRNSSSEQPFGFLDTGSGSGISASAGFTHSFKPRLQNSLTFNLSRNNNKAAPFFAYTNNVAGDLGITGTSQIPITYGPPGISFTNFTSLSDGTASVTRNQTTGVTDALTWVIKRQHNITTGGTFQRYQQNNLSYANSRGTYSFSGLLTSQLTDGQPAQGTGYDFADFLLGLPQSTSVQFGSNNYFRSWSANWYVQDDFRISRGLSLNFGLRYEYWAPYTELYGHLANLDLSPGFTAATVVTPGSGNLPSSLVRSRPNNYSPRFGFAWRPNPKRSTVLRGGYSIFYSGSAYATIASQMASQPPFKENIALSTSPENPLTLENGFPTQTLQDVTNTYAVDPNYKIAYAQQWVMAIQNTLPHGLLAEVEYLGTKGTNLGVVEAPNQALPGSVLTAQQRLQIGNATGFLYQTSGANSILNAGQVRLTRRFQRGLSAVVLYTYSKSIDDASTFSGSGGTVVQYIDNWGLERGLSNTDQRHRLSFTYQASSPVGVRGMLRNGGWKEAALAGWTLQGNFTAASGTPLTAKLGGNLANTGGTGSLGNPRAEATGLPVTGGDNPYFNLAAFTNPPSGFYGNAGNGTIPGLFQTSLNATLNRSFRLGESRRTLQLRLAANNALNHAVITGFGTTVNANNYGLPTSASATRTITLMLRLSF